MSENISSMINSSDDLHGKFLTFHIDAPVYGLELFHVIEIISIQAVTKVPHVPEYVKGIINLRGKIVPVIDVRLKFGMPEHSYDENTSIIVVNLNELQMGIIVDSVSDVITITSEHLVGLPNNNTSEANKYLKNVIKINNRLILSLDLEAFFHENAGATAF